MRRDDLQRLAGVLDDFIAKASKRNEPLEAFRGTSAYKGMEGKFQRGIEKQIKWTAKELKKIDALAEEVTDDNYSQVKAKMSSYLEQYMPHLSKYVDAQGDVYPVLFDAFEFSVKAQYLRLGFQVKAVQSVLFGLTNEKYIAALKSSADYLLHKSKIDDTTRTNLINFVMQRKLNNDTIDEIADDIEHDFKDRNYPHWRAFLIANTETNRAMSDAQMAFLKETGFKTKVWVPAGDNTCEICNGNADDGPVPLDDTFSSGHSRTPGHPGCECYVDAGEEIDLDSISIWNGD